MRLVIARSAEKEIERLQTSVLERVRSRIALLADDPLPRDSAKLELEEAYRIRVGDYRIIHTVRKKEGIVTVLAVRHRREAYR